MNKKTKQMLDKKMQVKLPDSLSTENIIANIENSKANVIEIPKKKRNTKKIISMVATFAIIIGLLGTYLSLGLGDKKAPTTADNGDICEVVSYQSYDRLYEKFDQFHKNYKKNYYLYNTADDVLLAESFDGAVAGDAAPPESAPESDKATGTNSSTSNRDYGTTNNQEDGVEEGDIIKTDGNFLYIANGSKNSVSIVDINSKEMKESSQIDLDKYENIHDIYLNGDKLVLVGTGYGLEEKTTGREVVADTAYPTYSNMSSFVRVYDIKDRNAPRLVNEYAQQGYYNSSRMIGDKLYNISTYNVDVQTKNYRDNCIPEINVNGTIKQFPAGCIEIIEDTEHPMYTVITTLNLSENTEPDTEAILGNCQHIYASQKGLFICEPTNEFTKIYRFAYTDTGVHYKCMGKVEGYLHNQFSMSFDGEYFRVATTVRKTETTDDGFNKSVSVGDTVNNLYILNDQMQPIGSVEDLAEGETIKSVRFIGDMAYVVTFRQTDPLFVIDLSNPEKPTVKGELKIPGFSDYMHPIADGLLVGVGRDGNEFGETGNCKVSLFDVTNPYKPEEISIVRTSINNDAYCYSYVGENHKLYVTLNETEFAVPFTMRRNSWQLTDGTDSGEYYIRYKLSDDELCEIARYKLGRGVNILGATYVENTFYVVVQSYEYETSSENGTYIMAFDMITNELVGKIKTADIPKYE